jgi:MSHA biogenesis protein MshO
MRRTAGYTLIELILVIVIGGILASMISSFIVRPIQGSLQLSQRAALVDQADLALRRMARDIRRALPNSVRVNAAGDAIELLLVRDAGTYRSDRGNNIPIGGTGNHNSKADEDWLNFNGDDRFNILGRFRALGVAYGDALPAGTRLAIYTTDADETYTDAASGAATGVITPASTTIRLLDDSDEDALSLSDAFTFRWESPAQRVYVVDRAVSYMCAGGELRRYDGYLIQATQPAVGSLADGSLMAYQVTNCAASFRYVPGTSQRAGLVTLRLTLENGDAGRVELLRHVHVENTP